MSAWILRSEHEISDAPHAAFAKSLKARLVLQQMFESNIPDPRIDHLAVWLNLEKLENPHQRALARAALIRSCLKKQPRGVFTVSGDLSRYDDGRRDLRLTIEEHFLEQVEAFNRVVFDNGRRHTIQRADIFSLKP